VLAHLSAAIDVGAYAILVQPWEVVSLRTPSRPERAATPREGAAYQPGLAQPRAPQAVLRDGRGRPPSGGRMFGPQNERGQQGLEERRRSVGVMERQLARSRTALQRAQSGIESIRRQLRAPTALERPHGPVKEARAAQGGGAGAGARSSDGKAVGEGEGEAELALLEKHRAEHRREVQEYRRALFARPRRSYSREEQENLCRRLIGESDSSRMVQVGPLTRASCCRHPAHLLLPHDIKAQQSMRVHAGPWSHFER
jgi:hypothetical protein